MTISRQEIRGWLSERFEPRYNQCRAAVHGVLDVARFRDAAGLVFERHEVLRTVVRHNAFTVIGPDECREALQMVDLRGLGSTTDLIEEISREERVRRFSQDFGPLLRMVLARLDDAEWMLILTASGVCLDGESLRLFIQDLFDCYESGVTGCAPPPAGAPYARFAGARGGEPLEAGSAKCPGAADLEIFRSPGELGAEALARLSASANGSIERALLACWRVLLGRIRGESAPVVGSLASARMSSGCLRTLGPQTVVLPAGGSIDWQQPLRAIAAICPEVRSLSTGWLKDCRAAGQGTTMFRYGFSFGPAPVPRSSGPSRLRVTLSHEFAGSEPFEILLRFEQSEEGQVGWQWLYETGKFSRPEIERLDAAFGALIESFISNPATSIGAANIVCASDLRLLSSWNCTGGVTDDQRGFCRAFQEQADRRPEAVAVKDADQRLTYRELEQRTARLARYLRSLGVGPEVRVGICCRRSVEMLVAVLGVMRAGGAFVPLDPTYPVQRLAFLVEDAGVAVILAQAEVVPALPASVMVVQLDRDLSLSPEDGECSELSQPELDSAAYLMYTSGSTGRPKGVMATHRGLMNYLLWAADAYSLQSDSVAPVFSPLGFDLTITAMLTPLIAGGRVELFRPEEDVAGLPDRLKAGANYRLVKLTPAHLRVMEDLLPDRPQPGSVDRLVIGGEALSADRLSWWKKHSPDTIVTNEYGPTETVVGCCVHSTRAGTITEGDVPIGRPIGRTQIYVMDAFGRPLPTGFVGELYVGGAGVARGYFGHPAATAARFVPDGMSGAAGARLYRTGDRARRRPDGSLEFLGRVDDQVKIRGYRVEPREVTVTILQHPGVHDAVVVARADQAGMLRLIAYVVPADRSLTPEQLRAWLRTRLPDYLVPAAWVWLASLPLTSHGKLDHSALPAPDAARALSAPYEPPASEMERILAGIWETVLQCPGVGRLDNFFDLGGDSLLATRVIASLQQREGVELPISVFFDNTTVAGVSSWLETHLSVNTRHVAAMEVVDRGAPLPLSFAQERLFLLHELEGGGSTYNVCGAVRVRGPLDVRALQAGLTALLERHEVLRSAIRSEGGRAVQVVGELSDWRLETHDLREAGAEAEREAVRLAMESGSEPFDVIAGPVARACLIREAGEQYL
ncbi:MAG TPA: amino acid adenylation domain-containing protein, partial [Bryobacteraceae bacterium]|nr:amino acid adenylation domain-containing protein [Bryobacteraceae bacterium]